MSEQAETVTASNPIRRMKSRIGPSGTHLGRKGRSIEEINNVMGKDEIPAKVNGVTRTAMQEYQITIPINLPLNSAWDYLY